MIPAPFEYERASSVDEAIQMVGGNEEAKLLAGGHSLLPLMKLRLARPSLLVDIGRLSDLSYVREDGDHVAIGALTRHHDVHASPVLDEHCPLVSYTAGLIGDPQVRHLGTIGGSVAHGDPASDMPTVLLALDAEMVAQGPDGTRTIAAKDFFPGLFETALEPTEVLTEVRVPKLAGTGWSYQKFHRRAQDWAIVGVAAVTRNGDAAIAYTNMAERPLRASAVEQALAGGADPADAATHAAEGTNPPSDTFATAEYRQALAEVLVRRALEEARGRGS
ncbi:MAG: xanthine dehydrogenase family protein subunit M [Actinomycetota bacterium]|nr:xanthine dehydrogenase family protein subunit M [Actinomycetota bacterium]